MARKTTAIKEKTRPAVDRMCHCLKTMQRFLVSQVKSIFSSPADCQRPRWGKSQAKKGWKAYAHAAHVIHAAVAAVVHVTVAHGCVRGVVHGLVGAVGREYLMAGCLMREMSQGGGISRARAVDELAQLKALLRAGGRTDVVGLGRPERSKQDKMKKKKRPSSPVKNRGKRNGRRGLNRRTSWIEQVCLH